MGAGTPADGILTGHGRRGWQSRRLPRVEYPQAAGNLGVQRLDLCIQEVEVGPLHDQYPAMMVAHEASERLLQQGDLRRLRPLANAAIVAGSAQPSTTAASWMFARSSTPCTRSLSRLRTRSETTSAPAPNAGIIAACLDSHEYNTVFMCLGALAEHDTYGGISGRHGWLLIPSPTRYSAMIPRNMSLICPCYINIMLIYSSLYV